MSVIFVSHAEAWASGCEAHHVSHDSVGCFNLIVERRGRAGEDVSKEFTWSGLDSRNKEKRLLITESVLILY